jgi:hypothetical protein
MTANLHLVDLVTVTVTVAGEETEVTVPAGPLPDGLPVDVVAHLVAAGHATPLPAPKKTAAPKE